MEKMKTLTIGGVTYAVCAPLTEEEKQEVTQRVLGGISYEQILQPHKEAIANQAVKDVKAGLDMVTRTLTVEDFTIGRVSTTSAAFDSAATNGVGTQEFLPCTAAEPYAVAVNGIIADSSSTVRVVYYNADKDILGAVPGVKNSYDSLCDFATFNSDEKLVAQRDAIRYIRITILWPSANGAVTDANKADIVNQFTFTRKCSDPMARQSKLAGYLSREAGAHMQLEMDYCTGKNLICTAQQKSQGGIVISHTGGGQYAITQSNATSDVSIEIYNNPNVLPPNIEKGKTYRFGGNFPDGASMRILVYTGADHISDNSVSRQNTKDIAIPEDATGMAVYLFFNREYDYTGKTVYTEMIAAESTKYACDLVRKHHPDVAPPPMLTIIDDDGYKAFEHLMGIVQRKKIPIASAIPIQEIETRPNLVMDWDTIVDYADQGAEILSHTYSNLGVEKAREVTKDANGKDVYGKRLMTDAQIIHDYRLAQAQLRRRGLNGDGLVFVKDSSNLPECVSACRQVYSYGFKADPSPGINSTNPLINYKGSTDRYGILRNGATGATDDQLKEMIHKLLVFNKDGTVTAGTGWLVLMLHTSTSTYDATQVGYLEKAIEYIQGLTDDNGEQLIQIVTTEYGANAYCD